MWNQCSRNQVIVRDMTYTSYLHHFSTRKISFRFLVFLLRLWRPRVISRLRLDPTSKLPGFFEHGGVSVALDDGLGDSGCGFAEPHW